MSSFATFVADDRCGCSSGGGICFRLSRDVGFGFGFEGSRKFIVYFSSGVAFAMLLKVCILLMFVFFPG
jgi:hypothetical protein